MRNRLAPLVAGLLVAAGGLAVTPRAGAATGATLTPVVSFTCASTSASPGHGLVCTASQGAARTSSYAAGTVTFSGGIGSFSPATCAWSGGSSPSSCSTTYTPRKNGTAPRNDTLKAAYGGDATWKPASATLKIAVAAPTAPTLQLSCANDLGGQGVVQTRGETCTLVDLTSSDYPEVRYPTGTVTFSGTNGKLSPASCAWTSTAGNAPTCQTTYTPNKGTAQRTDTVTAKYVSSSDYWQNATASTTTTAYALSKPTLNLSCENPFGTNGSVQTRSETCTVEDRSSSSYADVLYPRGTLTFSGANGTFSPASCTWSTTTDYPQCVTSYTPKKGSAQRTDTVTATYVSSDGYWQNTAVSTTTTAYALPKPTLRLGCVNDFGGDGVVQTRSETCTLEDLSDSSYADVRYPTGTVTFSSPNGTFGPATCTWSMPATEDPQCVTRYTPNQGATTRSDTLTAKYVSGDGYWQNTSTTVTTTAYPLPKPTLRLGCVNDFGGEGVVQTRSETCTLEDLSDSSYSDVRLPRGTVTLSSPNGTFSPATCTWADVSGYVHPQCVSRYTPNKGTAKRTDTLTAKYVSNDGYWQNTSTTTTTTAYVLPKPTLQLACANDFGGTGVVQTRSETCTLEDLSDSGYSDVRYPRGTVTLSSPNGRFSPASCTWAGVSGYDRPQCVSTYTPNKSAATRTDTLTAKYVSSDGYWQDASTTTTTTAYALPKPSIIVACGTTRQGVAITCEALDQSSSDYADVQHPTGTLKLTGSNGTLDTASCTWDLSSSGLPACSFTYTPKTSGTVQRTDTVTVAYGGDSYWQPVTVKAPVVVQPDDPGFTVSCGDGGIAPGPVTCTASAVAQDGITTVPTGTVSFSVDGGTTSGTFSAASCALKVRERTASCSVTYTTKRHNVTDAITAKLPGKAPYGAASAQASVVTGRPDPALSLTCAKDWIDRAGVTTTCTARVVNVPIPTGKITFTVQRPGTGTFSATTCTLVAYDDFDAACTVTWKPSGSITAARSDVLVAAYGGSTRYGAEKATTVVGYGIVS